MANADFEQSHTPRGGFAAGSYQSAQAQKKPAQSLSPAQQKLAGAEKALPTALKSSAVAAALAAVMLAASIFGIGGAKLRAHYTKTENALVIGVAADTDGGKYNDFTVMNQLTARGSAAANVITTGGHVLGKDNTYVTAAQKALDEFNVSMDTADAAELYAANVALGTSVDALYAEMQSQTSTPLKMGTVQTQYAAFNSAGQVLNTLHYNEAAQEYNDTTSGFPGNVLGALWGCGKVELFA